MGSDGHSAKNMISTSNGLANSNARALAAGSTGLGDIMSKYAGGGSLSDALAASKKAATGRIGADSIDSNNAGAYEGGLNDALATNAQTAGKYAEDQMRGSSVYGNAMKEEGELSKQGYQLTPDDHTAYGQASGDIARQFGSQEQSLAQSLADRGLSSAPSGAAGAGFSGLQGNKMEQLAKMQTNIADKRMQLTNQRLNATRSMLASGLNNTRNANMDSVKRQTDENHQQNADSMAHQEDVQNQENEAFQQKESTKSDPLGDIASTALSVGTGALTGGFGAAAGKGLGQSLFGSKTNNGSTGANTTGSQSFMGPVGKRY